MRLSSTISGGTIGLVVVALVGGTGCLQTIGEQTKDAIGADGASQEVQSPAEEQGPGTTETTQGQAREAYMRSFNRLTSSEERVQRFSMNLSAVSDQMGAPVAMRVLLDASDHLLVMTIENESGSALGEQGPEGKLVVGQVAHTMIIGIEEVLFTEYDVNQSMPEENLSLTQPDGAFAAGQDAGDQDDPSDILSTFTELPEGTTFTPTETTYEGEPATEIQATFDNGSVSADLRAIFLDAPERPLLVEGTISDPNDVHPGDLSGEITMHFQYGDAAKHPLEAAALRTEAMALAGKDDSDGSNFGFTSGANQTLVVQPSQNAGMIGLDEVEVVAAPSNTDRSSLGASNELRLPAEEGALENETLRIEYADLDGDGRVTPGDEIRLSVKNASGTSYDLALEDEVTGVRSVPGAGAVLAIAAIGVAVAVTRWRPHA